MLRLAGPGRFEGPVGRDGELAELRVPAHGPGRGVFVDFRVVAEAQEVGTVGQDLVRALRGVELPAGGDEFAYERGAGQVRGDAD